MGAWVGEVSWMTSSFVGVHVTAIASTPAPDLWRYGNSLKCMRNTSHGNYPMSLSWPR